MVVGESCVGPAGATSVDEFPHVAWTPNVVYLLLCRQFLFPIVRSCDRIILDGDERNVL